MLRISVFAFLLALANAAVAPPKLIAIANFGKRLCSRRCFSAWPTAGWPLAS